MSDRDLKNTAQRTEEVRDIVDRMPHRTGKIVAMVVAALCILLVLFGWLIEYPETISGAISITARQAPVRLVSNISGKLHLLKNNGALLHENDIIAMIDNPANQEDVLVTEHFLEKCKLDSLISSPANVRLPEITTLGELSSVYFTFCDALGKMKQYSNSQPYEKKQEGLKSQLVSQIQLFQYNREQIKTRKQSLKITRKSMQRDSLLFRSSAIAELDLDRSSVSYLSALENTQAMNKEDANYQLQMNETRHQIQLLQIEQQETEQKLKMNLITGYNELVSSIRQWKQRYLFIAPFAGSLEYLNFWRENDFLSAGTETFSVLPADNHLLGQVYLPSSGAGKVKPRQKVIIKLDNYPYMEYGAIDGLVQSISMLSNKTEIVAGQNKVFTYQVSVDLPRQLTTNYGATLDSRYEIKGVAEIITKPRKLIERLFDNLKYIASKK